MGMLSVNRRLQILSASPPLEALSGNIYFYLHPLSLKTGYG
jgi:hypothetical protein